MGWFTGVVILSIWGGVAFAASPLDETDWRLEITPKGAEIPWYIDRVRFHEGEFNSALFERKGFPKSKYTVKKEGGSIVWDIMQTSGAEGGLAWHGELQKDAVKGALRWTKTDGTVIDHTFTGSKFIEEPAPSEATPKTPAPEPKPKASAPKTKKKAAPPSP
jgi:hypothetical protein